MFFKTKSAEMPHPDNVLSGRSQAIATASNHHITGNPLRGPYPDGLVTAMFGMGCFWGAEKIFWSLPGVFITAVGYAAGGTPNPTYEEVCSGLTGHNEIVFVVFDPKQTSYEALLKVFWEGHNPTQGMRQGNDSGDAIQIRNLHLFRRTKTSGASFSQTVWLRTDIGQIR